MTHHNNLNNNKTINSLSQVNLNSCQVKILMKEYRGPYNYLRKQSIDMLLVAKYDLEEK